MHKSLDEFEFRPKSTTDSYMELAAFEGLKVYPRFFWAILILIYLILADKQKVLALYLVFEFRPDRCFKFGVTCL